MMDVMVHVNRSKAGPVPTLSFSPQCVHLCVVMARSLEMRSVMKAAPRLMVVRIVQQWSMVGSV